MATVTQRSFSGGEISPSLYARTDFSKYSTSLRTCRNFIVQKHGGAANRPGTMFVGEVSDSSKAVRLIPFIFNSDQAYVLEFGQNYIRFIRDGNYIQEAAKNISNITMGGNTTLTVVAHGYSAGQEIYVSGIVGTVELNNRNFKVGIISVNVIQLFEMDGITSVNSGTYSAYVSGGTTERVYQVTTTYQEADLPYLQYAQSADVITIVNNNYAPSEITRISDTSWTFFPISFKSDVGFATNLTTPLVGVNTRYREWKVTAIRKEDYRESNSAINVDPYNITSITKANPARVTIASGPVLLPLYEGDEVYLTVNGMTELNGRRFYITNVSGLAFDLIGIDSTNYGTFTSGVFRQAFVRQQADTISSSATRTITWAYAYTVTDAEEFNVYRRDDLSGAFGLVGVVKGNSFVDVGLTPDFSKTPPSERNPFVNANDYPGVVNYFQQRLVLANTINDTEKIFTSKIGDFKNFGVSSPIQNDDSITFKIAGRQVNAVKHIIDLNKLVVFTAGGEYVVNGDQANIVTPTDINVRAQTYNGASYLQPIIINNSALYVQARGSIVRDLAFSFESDGFTGNDLTVLAFHLFEGQLLTDWAFQQQPHSVVWVVRDDGTLLGLTLLKDQQIVAWHRHDFEDGFVENVCVIPEGDEDSLYVTVRRTINGRSTRYVERLSTRRVDLIEDSTFLDSYLTYDGRNTTSTTMTLSGGTTWAYDNDLVLTASAAFFTAGDVGNSIQMFTDTGEILRCSITAYISTTVVTVRGHKTTPVSLRGVATATWNKAVDQVSGLFYLEGQDVSIFADGFVVANPNNDAYNVVTVTNGSITLDKPYAVIHVGLPYTSDLQTLNIDTAQGETLADKKIQIQELTMFVEESRGVWAGSHPPDESVGFLDGLTEVKVRNGENYDSPVDLTTGVFEVEITSEYNNNGRVFVRQTDPLPITLLSINPAGQIPFRR